MTGRLLLGVALVTNVLVLVYCTGHTADASGTSPASATYRVFSRSSARANSHTRPKSLKCRRVKRCPQNEEFSYCPQSLHRAQYCSEKGQPYRHSTTDMMSCKEGCVCKEDYLRADNGTCIPAEQCPITCGDDEVLDNCPADCDSDYCLTEETTEACLTPDVCPPPVCKCGFNRRRAFNGSCILTRDCPPFDCSARPNEEYNPCPPLCPTDDCSQATPTGECPPRFGNILIILPCNPTCRCIKGYWRLDGICVPYGQCPQTCPANEEFVPCIQGVCRAMNCSQKGEDVPCPDIPQEICDSGCICKENFLRAEDGSCVPEDQCQSNVCPPNEEWSECAQATCRAQNCTQIGEPIACPRVMQGYCIKACVCKENYLRNENGDCVPQDQCTPQLTCGENEVLENCPSICNSDYCPKSEDEDQFCFKPEPCVPACKCRLNYRRDDNGICIPTRSCPPFDCSARPNEEYVACPPLCPSDECNQPRLKGRCPFRIGTVLNCVPKCQCMDGYGRVDGICVPFEDCPDLCPAHEEYSPCVEQTCRPQNCSNRDVQMETCPTCDAASCHRGCVCQENYYRNKIGICVPYELCSGPLCPYAHEIYTPDFKACPPNICKSLVSKYACDENQPTTQGCLCAPGYLRFNLTTPCIPICDCPEMAGSLDC